MTSTESEIGSTARRYFLFAYSGILNTALHSRGPGDTTDIAVLSVTGRGSSVSDWAVHIMLCVERTQVSHMEADFKGGLFQ